MRGGSGNEKGDGYRRPVRRFGCWADRARSKFGGSTSAPAASRPSQTGIDALETATINTAATVSPKVVEIQSASGLGSGEILDPRGYIVTNYHVLSGGGVDLQPPFSVTLANGHTYPARVAGTDA